MRSHVFHLRAVLRDRSNTVERSLEDGCQVETCRIENKRLTKIVPHWVYTLIPADVSTKTIAVISVCIDTVEIRTAGCHAQWPGLFGCNVPIYMCISTITTNTDSTLMLSYSQRQYDI